MLLNEDEYQNILILASDEPIEVELLSDSHLCLKEFKGRITLEYKIGEQQDDSGKQRFNLTKSK